MFDIVLQSHLNADMLWKMEPNMSTAPDPEYHFAVQAARRITEADNELRAALIAMSQAKFTAALTARAKSLESLYDYTKFHIGVYLTLTASYITVSSVKTGGASFEISAPARAESAPAVTKLAVESSTFLTTEPISVAFAVAFFLIAGFAGGVIVSFTMLSNDLTV